VKLTIEFSNNTPLVMLDPLLRALTDLGYAFQSLPNGDMRAIQPPQFTTGNMPVDRIRREVEQQQRLARMQ
jgi:hypothetical protein